MKHHLKHVFLALIISFTATSYVFLAHDPSLYRKEIIKPLADTGTSQSAHVVENPYTKVLAAETQQSSSTKQQSSEVIYDSSGENLVLNSSYEANSGDEPKYWDITDSQQKQYSLVTDPVRSGDKSLKVTLNGKTIALYGKTSQDTASKAPYTLSVSLNLSSFNCSGTKCTVTLGLTDSNPQNKLHTKAFTIDSTFPTNTWVRMSATFDNSQLTKLNPFIEFESDFSSGTLYIDDVKLEIGSHYTEYSQTNGLSVSDGAISADKHGNLYPTKSNSGGLGTTNKKWLSLDLKSASIDKNGNLSVDGDAAIGGTADVTGDLHVIGKVGIGTTAPLNKLDVNGSVSIGSLPTTILPQSNMLYVSGNVGIGTTSPAGNLDVVNTGVLGIRVHGVENAALRVQNDASDGDFLDIQPTTSGVDFQVNDTTVLRLSDTNGNVGIGTTSPIQKLQVVGSVLIDSGVLQWINGNPEITSAWDKMDVFLDTDANVSDDVFRIWHNGTTSATAANIFTINNSGNVGIGTTSPNAMLQIGSNTGTSNGEIVLSRSSGASNRSFKIGLDNRYFFSVGDYANGEGPYTPFLTIDYGSGNTGIGTSTPVSKLAVLGNAAIGATYGNRLAPTSGLIIEGNVGIGTTLPAQKLDVVGNANLSSGSAYYINGASVLNATTLGSGVTASSLTSVGIITTGTWNATTIDVAHGGTGATSLSNNYLVKGNGTSAVSSSVIYDNGTNVGIGTTNPAQLLSTYGDFVGYSGGFFNDGNADTRQGLFVQGCLDTNPTSACNFLEFRDGNGTVLGAVEGNGAGGVTNASAGSDYAELFNGDRTQVERGDLLGIDTGGNVVPATINTRLLGVYSVKPATLGNWKDGWENDNGVVPVGLLGQLPVKVSTENGEITAGDFLTVSSKGGVAMKADKSGHTIGRALENASKDGEILAYISTDYYTTDDLLKSASDDVRSSVKTLSEDYTKTFEKYDEELSQTKSDVKDIKKDIKSIWDLLEVLTLNDSNLKVKVNLNVDGDIAFKSAVVSETIEVGIIKINAKDGSIIATEIKADKGTFDELTVKSLKIDSKDDSHKITGSGKLTAGEKSVTIDSKEAKDDSKIFITPTTKTNNQTLYVSDVKDGNGFDVSIEESQTDDIKFNWWIIN